MVHIASIFAGLLLMGGQPEPLPPDADEHTVEGVVVTAPSRQSLDDFVDELAYPADGGRVAGQLPRWHREICPSAIGSSPAVNAYLARRVAEVARSVNVRTGGGSCQPNLVIVVTNEADRLAETLARTHRVRLFGPSRRNELKGFLKPSRAVRWWHDIDAEPGDGSTAAHASTAGVQLSPGSQVPFFVLPNSRLRVSTRQTFSRAFVIVDSERVKGVPSSALSHYIAMVALARLPQEVEFKGVSSVLSLFQDHEAGRPMPEGLTMWDRAYLTGLYRASPERRIGRQTAEIRSQMRVKLHGDPK